jgi:calcium-dependent protein kinase
VFGKENFVLSKKTKFSDDYKLKETLGEGAFGVVGKCENLISGAIRAVKMLSKKNISNDDLKSIANEIKLCKEIDHPNIMKMYEEYEDKKFLYIVTELIEGGELFDELIRRKKFTEKDCALIIKQILEALAYCHAEGIAHKDLKPENILLHKKKDISSIKLIDFGTGERFNKDAKMSTVIGTPYYVAPEVLEGSYDEKCDVWGVGVIMFVLLSGTPPFNGKNDDEIMKNVRKGKYEFKHDKWKGVSDEAKNLIDQMLVLDPEDRISATEAIEHEWFDIVYNDDYEPKGLKGAISGLKKFEAEKKMQQAAIGFIVTQLATREDTEELDKAFKKIDINHDGMISLEELLKGAQEVFPEMTEEEVRELFKRADTNNSGDIKYTEWIQATINKKALLTEKNLKSAFKAFDEDGNGLISADEIKKFLGQGRNIEEHVWKEILAEVDENGDGEIDYKEFKSMMKKFIE